MSIEYYGNSVANCSYGIILEKDGVFIIDWEDTPNQTILDGSEYSNKILKECGFGF